MPFAAVLCLLIPIDDPLADLQRFPPHAYVDFQCELRTNQIKAHRDQFCIFGEGEVAGAFSPTSSRPWVRLAAVEDLRAMESDLSCWRTLWEATNCGNDILVRVEALQSLRAKIGERAWAAGQMPPPIPWRWATPVEP